MSQTISETRRLYPLSKKKIIKKTLSNILAWLIVFIIVYGVVQILRIAAVEPIDFQSLQTVLDLVAPTLFIILVILSFSTYLYQWWYFNVYYYDLSENVIVIRKGPITPTEINIPYERVQDIYVDQDFLDRFFGLYDVHLSSATASSGMQAHIDGVEKLAADGLRESLLKIVHQKIGGQTKEPHHKASSEHLS